MDISIYIVLNVVVFLLLCIGVQLRQIKEILKGNNAGGVGEWRWLRRKKGLRR